MQENAYFCTVIHYYITKRNDVTAPEYKQLKAFARVDGALLAVLMITCFACYVAGLTSPLYGFLSIVAIVMMPFFAGIRLKRFRDTGLEGSISFMRGWAYICLMFFYGGLIFALAQYAYMAYMDKGYLVMTITNILALPENAEVIKQLGMADQVSESIHMLQAMRPIDFALNMLTTIIMGGIMLGLPIAAIMKKVKVEN